MSDDIQKKVNILEKTKNVILTGAPGTGKTYLAKQIAYAITGDKEENHPHVEFVQFHPSYDYTDFVEGLRPIPLPSSGENCNIGFALKDGTFKSFCRKAITASLDKKQDNFDSSWQRLVDTLNEKSFLKIENLSGRGEFEIELNEYGTGLASRTYASEEEKANHNWIHDRSKFFNKDQLYNVYRGLPGVPNGGHDNYREAVIKTMRKDFGLLEYRAGIENADKKQNYVFIIDEINRGDIAKIFGELFFAIDPGYRGEKGRVETKYSQLIDEQDVFKKGFYVPDNVYIIGTMNDIDRNVESMDFAIRRRFTWIEIKPEDNIGMLDGLNDQKLKKQAEDTMKAINKAITDDSNLGAAYQLGASYFLKLKDYSGDFGELWKYHIEPLLTEYLRGMPNAKNTIKKIWDKYKQLPTTANPPQNNDAVEQSATQDINQNN